VLHELLRKYKKELAVCGHLEEHPDAEFGLHALASEQALPECHTQDAHLGQGSIAEKWVSTEWIAR
jgi:hypothetical protein